MSEDHRVHSRAWRDYASCLAEYATFGRVLQVMMSRDMSPQPPDVAMWVELFRREARTSGDGGRGRLADLHVQVLAYRLLETAKVIAVDADTLHVCEEMVGGFLDQHVKDPSTAIGPADMPKLMAAASQLGWPVFPFASTFVATQLTAEMTEQRRSVYESLLYSRTARPHKLLSVEQIGYVFASEAVTVSSYPGDPDPGHGPFAYLLLRLRAIYSAGDAVRTTVHAIWLIDDRGWIEHVVLQAFVLHALAAAVDQCNTAVVRVSPSSARLSPEVRELSRKGLARHIPREYRALTLTPGLRWEPIRHETTTEQPPATALTVRHDVRAHWRVLLRGGGKGDEGACPPGVRLALERRGYVVVDAEHHAAAWETDDGVLVRSRGFRPAPGTWWAYLKIRVREHVRGPEDAPLIPAVRRVRPEM